MSSIFFKRRRWRRASFLLCVFLSAANGAASGRALPWTGQHGLEDSLYRSVIHSWIPRALGWPTNVYTSTGVLINNQNIFIPLVIMTALDDAARYRRLPGLARLERALEQKLAAYRAFERRRGRPSGSLNYSSRLPYSICPSDFDTGSEAAYWLAARGRLDGYIGDFISATGRFRDVGRTIEDASDARWKTVNSGAFMTWAEPKEPGFIHGCMEWNNVDCIVNLRIISSAGLYERAGGQIPEPVRLGMRAACGLIARVLSNREETVCSPYYRRASQFYLAYAQAVDAAPSCLSRSASAARSGAIREARRLLAREDVSTLELSELIVALKKLLPCRRRPARIATLILAMTGKLRHALSTQGRQKIRPQPYFYAGYPDGKYGHVWFSSPPLDSALALEALAIP